MITLYNKLVRDKIPDIIRAKGQSPVVRNLGNGEYLQALDQKLVEEVSEWLESHKLEELADILEVITAIVPAYFWQGAWTDLEEAMKTKREERGGFDKTIMLISVDDHGIGNKEEKENG